MVFGLFFAQIGLQPFMVHAECNRYFEQQGKDITLFCSKKAPLYFNSGAGYNVSKKTFYLFILMIGVGPGFFCWIFFMACFASARVA